MSKGSIPRPMADRKHYGEEHERLLGKKKRVELEVGKDGASASSSFIGRRSYVWSQKEGRLVEA